MSTHSSTSLARKLRREQTPAENRLWWHLRNRQFHGWKFRRQVPIEGYIADFVCIDAKLVIELDGGQHSDRVLPDALRSERLERAGFVVVRFWNDDVLPKTDNVLDEVYRMLHPDETSPSPEQPGTWVTVLTGNMGNTFPVLFTLVVVPVDPVGNAQRCPQVHRRVGEACAGDRHHGQ
ncbi:MAG: endonuclease domain-containing protein [Hyphomicrobiales bacterium]